MTENQRVCPHKFKFCRVMLLGFSTQLAIPQRLTKYFVNENLTSVTLLSPLGNFWNVRICGNSAGLHFGEGWGRFAAAHRLSFGDLLVFKCVASGVFGVTIFDKSTCEKDYYKVTNIGVAGDDHFPAGQVEINNCYQESERFKGKTATPPSSSPQRSTTTVMVQESSEDQTQEAQKLVRKAKTATKHLCKRRSRFVVTISAKLKYGVVIPVKFARSNDLLSLHQILLRDPKRHLWPVNLRHYKQSVGYNDYLQLTTGWREFRIGNELKDGDVCIFELKKKNEMFVQIQRSCEEGAKYTNQDGFKGQTHIDSSCRSKQTVQLKRAAILPKKRPPSRVTPTSKPTDSTQFESTIVPTNLRKKGNMNIPKAFLSSVDLSAEKEVILVDPNSRRWPVKIQHGQTDGRCRMQGNDWARFCDENGVQVGDECVFTFEYTRGEAIFHVEMIKSKDT